ncbi:hypothetical protein F5Y05DRAFT_419340 [Hypoxylon sp. FL0543]|nr:hypothetical protein F5Y05DRAFT_419340 [Hypoxylon sp. FL0543]
MDWEETGNGADTNTNDNAATTFYNEAETSFNADGSAGAADADANARVDTANGAGWGAQHQSAGVDAEQANVEPEISEPGDSHPWNPQPADAQTEWHASAPQAAIPAAPSVERPAENAPERGYGTQSNNVEPANPRADDSPPQRPRPAVANAAAPSAPPATPNPDLDKRIPLALWLVVGGTGQPPKKRNFERMVRERRAAGRAQEARAAARKQALEERKKYLADWEKEWGPVGVTGLVCKLLGSNRRKKKKG